MFHINIYIFKTKYYFMNVQLNDTYSLFNELSSQRDYNFFGVIYDASFSIIEDPSSPSPYYEITLKLVDPSMNCLTLPSSPNKNVNDCILTLIIKSNLKECMPYIHSIGDIIRVRHGSYNPSKKTVYLLLTGVTKIISGWCLFSGHPDSENKISTPLMCSHSNCIVDAQDVDILQGIRKWLGQNFQIKNSLVYPNDVKLESKKKGGQLNDSVVQIIHKYEHNNKIVYIVQDETERCEMHSLKYFNFFEVNDIVRLTNYVVNANGEIQMKKNTNMLIVPKFTDYYKSFSHMIERNKQFLDGAFDLGAMIAKWEHHEEVKSPEKVKEVQYIIKINLEFYLNVNFLDDVQSCSSEKNKAVIDVKIKELLYPKILYRFSNENYFNLVFKCEVRETNENIILHLCDYDKEGEGFLKDLKAENAKKDGSDLKEIIDELLNFDGYCKLLVEKTHFKILRQNTDIMDIDSEDPFAYRIVGKYNWINNKNI